MSNPDVIRQMLESNPQMQEVMERNPEIRQMLNNPEVLRQVEHLNENCLIFTDDILDDGDCPQPQQASGDDPHHGQADAELGGHAR